MEEPSNPSKIVQVSIWFRMVLTQLIIRYTKDSLTLTYPQNQYLTGTTNLICSEGSLIPLLVLIIDTHAIHLQDQTNTRPYLRTITSQSGLHVTS